MSVLTGFLEYGEIKCQYVTVAGLKDHEKDVFIA